MAASSPDLSWIEPGSLERFLEDSGEEVLGETVLESALLGLFVSIDHRLFSAEMATSHCFVDRRMGLVVVMKQTDSPL